MYHQQSVLGPSRQTRKVKVLGRAIIHISNLEIGWRNGISMKKDGLVYSIHKDSKNVNMPPVTGKCTPESESYKLLWTSSSVQPATVMGVYSYYLNESS